MLALGNQCLRFECGDLSVPDQTKCGELDGDVYHLKECPKGYHCETEDYYDPSDAGDAYCIPDKDDDNTEWGLAPGDMCFEGDTCFGDGECLDGICVPIAGGDGESCAEY